MILKLRLLIKLIYLVIVKKDKITLIALTEPAVFRSQQQTDEDRAAAAAHSAAAAVLSSPSPPKSRKLYGQSVASIDPPAPLKRRISRAIQPGDPPVLLS